MFGTTSEISFDGKSLAITKIHKQARVIATNEISFVGKSLAITKASATNEISFDE